jgi:hypothetical protein
VYQDWVSRQIVTNALTKPDLVIYAHAAFKRTCRQGESGVWKT